MQHHCRPTPYRSADRHWPQKGTRPTVRRSTNQASSRTTRASNVPLKWPTFGQLGISFKALSHRSPCSHFDSQFSPPAMSTDPFAAAPSFEPQPGLRKRSSGQDLMAVPTLSRRTPHSKAKRQSRVGVEFASTISRPSRLSLVTGDSVLHEEEQAKDERRKRNRAFAVQELVESERQYSRTLQFMINVAIPLAQGYAPQPIGDVATKERYLPQGSIDPVGPPVLATEDIELVFGPGPYELYQGSCHITNTLDKEISNRGFEKARVGEFLVFAVGGSRASRHCSS